MKNRVRRPGKGIPVEFRGFLSKALGGPVLLAAFVATAHAGAVGICINATAFGTAETTAQYATTVVEAGCIPGFSDTIAAGGTVSPSSFASGLTTATLEATQTMPFGGTAVAIGTASLDEGLLRDYSDTEGTIGGCGGTCMTTGGRAIGESLFSDNVHFTILDAAPSAIVTLHAHLDGAIGLEAGASGNYSVQEEFILGGHGCWGSATGLGAQPCGSQNFGFITSAFTNQSATGFDFTGTFQVANGDTDPFLGTLNVDCLGGALCDFSNTASFSLSLPSDVTFTSDSGVLFTETGTAPEPSTIIMGAAGLLCLGFLRRRNLKFRR